MTSSMNSCMKRTLGREASSFIARAVFAGEVAHAHGARIAFVGDPVQSEGAEGLKLGRAWQGLRSGLIGAGGTGKSTLLVPET